jgi:hypothetical protein
MGSVDYKAFELDNNMKYLQKVAVIKNYYLVIGGEKLVIIFWIMP